MLVTVVSHAKAHELTERPFVMLICTGIYGRHPAQTVESCKPGGDANCHYYDCIKLSLMVVISQLNFTVFTVFS